MDAVKCNFISFNYISIYKENEEIHFCFIYMYAG